MHFKHPEILYFLFLLVIPILVHLFQLRRFQKQYFTNVRFLQELSIQTRKSSKLKKWLLLCTRLFILACIVIAFAQPFFEAKDHKNATNELFIVLDNSFSMQAKGQKGELLKRAVQDLLESVPENQSFSLITNTDTYWNTDIKSVHKELQDLNYSASPFQLDHLIAKIKAKKSPYKKDIVIITDGIDLNEKQLKSIDSSTTTYFVIPKAENKNNVSIDSVYLHQTLDNFYEIKVKASAYGELPKSIPVALYNQKKLIAKTVLSFDKKEQEIAFTIPKEDFHGYVSITDNALDYDNQLFFSISKPQKTNVISIGTADKSSFLSRIYTEPEFEYSNSELNTLDYNILEKQDAIILNELKEIPQALQTTLKSFATKGENIVLIPSIESNLSNLNGFIGSYGAIQFQALKNTERLITKIAFNNPLYQSVFEKKIDNFQYPKAKASFDVRSSLPSILTFEDQNTFLTGIQNPIQAVYVFTAPINTENSNFQNSPLIVPTFYNMAQNNQKSGVTALYIGDNKPYFIDALLTKDEIVSIKNDTEQFIPVQQILNNKVKLTFNDYPEQAGNFSIYKQDNIIQNISFNYNRTESDIAKASNPSLSNYTTIDRIDAVFDTLQSDRTNNEIWRWFVVLTLLFLATEIFIQKFVK
ncbi:vWA domain-containing protein [Flavobacterium sp. '19STA2R22 D10 B1']|uniref:vWA domain-containing protein n=1 Tax=Flavobacterium aerium TaxID=3037261 RepID=UPI00278BF0E2|nr:BatA and WFA domain-containing protein [Flavobacterium sp. '19STA2R22 D10 B1']